MFFKLLSEYEYCIIRATTQNIIGGKHRLEILINTI